MVDWKNPPRLFIPGPVKVNEDVLQQLARPTLGHRGKEYAQLHGETAEMLKKIFFTDQNVFLPALQVFGRRPFEIVSTLMRRSLPPAAAPSAISGRQ